MARQIGPKKLHGVLLFPKRDLAHFVVSLITAGAALELIGLLLGGALTQSAI